MKKNLLATLIASVLITPTVLADSPSYNFVEVNYTDIDEEGLSADGIGFAGSVELGENFFLTGEYAPLDGEIEFFNVDFDFDVMNFGLGYQSEFGENSSWFVSYTFGNWELANEDIDVDTFRAGLRSMTTDSLELNASLASYDIEGESETGFQVGLAYSVSDNVQVTFDLEDIDDLDIMTFGARMTF